MRMSGEVITLNVGGVIYDTTRSTLAKHPDSMLGAMFSGHYLPTAAFDSQGRYFIDRDGEIFRHVLNFLRSGRLCLPKNFQHLDLLEAEADFYQVPSLIAAIRSLRAKSGFHIEMLDFEESSYFYRFYSDPPRGIHTDLKQGGLVISGARDALLTLPLPEKTLKDLQTGDASFRVINLSNSACNKMSIVHHLHNSNWQLLSTSFVNNTDNDGSYMVHKYIWFQPR